MVFNFQQFQQISIYIFPWLNLLWIILCQTPVICIICSQTIFMHKIVHSSSCEAIWHSLMKLMQSINVSSKDFFCLRVLLRFMSAIVVLNREHYLVGESEYWVKLSYSVKGILHLLPLFGYHISQFVSIYSVCQKGAKMSSEPPCRIEILIMDEKIVNRTWTEPVGEDQRSSLLRAWFTWGLVQFILVQDLRF